MNKIILISSLILVIFISGCIGSGTPPSEMPEDYCEVDIDCIPLPSECHPMTCINKAYEGDYEKPEVCTAVFMAEAAYKPDDCICQNNICTNKNIGRTMEDLE